MRDAGAFEPDPETLRREAMGAFAHEIRTPLTSIRMVIELARRKADAEGTLQLDRELAAMLLTSVETLQGLADDLQEMSRLERGKVALAPGPCDLAAAVAAAAALCGGNPAITSVDSVPQVEGPWDAARLVRAIAGLTRSVNRMGDGSGVVRLTSGLGTGEAWLELESGEPGGDVRPLAADAGFSYFRGRQLVVTMGGSVHCERRERFARVLVKLRLGDAGGSGGGSPR